MLDRVMVLCLLVAMQNHSNSSLTLQQLRRAVVLQEQIEDLRTQLGELFGGGTAIASPRPARGGFKRSAATRAKMAAAQKARYAMVKAQPIPANGKVTRRFSATARARMRAAANARWARLKSAKGPKAKVKA